MHLSESLPLWHVHQDVKFFAELFVHDRLSLLIGDSCDLSQISITEKARIYRAIYWFSIIGNLFYIHDTARVDPDDLSWAQDQSDAFMTLFTASEVEEISCINDFMNDKIIDK